MRDDLEQRAKELALYMIENRTTVRAAAKKFGVSNPPYTRTCPSVWLCATGRCTHR